MIGRIDPETGKVVWTASRPEEDPNPRDLSLSRHDPGTFVARQENPIINREVWHRCNRDGEAMIAGRREAEQYADAINRHHDKGRVGHTVKYDQM